MAVEAKITLNKNQYVQELEAVKNKTVTATQTMSQKAKGVGENFSRVGGAASAMGSVVGQKFGAIGQAISAVAAGPMGVFMAAVAALIALFMKLWDICTVNAEETTARFEAMNNALNNQQKIMDLEQKAVEKYAKRLQDLSSKEKLSNNEKKETIKLVNSIEKAYGKVGVIIDQTTGKVTNLDQVQKRIAARQVYRQLELEKMKHRNQKASIEASFGVLTTDILGLWNTLPGSFRRQLLNGEMSIFEKRARLNSIQKQTYEEEGGEGLLKLYQELLNTGTVQRDAGAIEAINKMMSKISELEESKIKIDMLRAQQVELNNTAKESKKDEKTKSINKEAAEKIANAQILTNALSARGGFATGGRVEGVASINRQINNSVKNIANTLNSVNNKLDNADKVRL